jgi:hypothetical protein
MGVFNYIVCASLNRRCICLKTGFFGGKGLVSDFFILGFLFILDGVACGNDRCFACLM